jgi:hypothetical protein
MTAAIMIARSPTKFITLSVIGRVERKRKVLEAWAIELRRIVGRAGGGWAACGLIRITRMRNGNHEDCVV